MDVRIFFNNDYKKSNGTMVTIKVVSFVTTCTVFVAFVSVILQAYLESAHLSKVTALVLELTKLEHNIGMMAARRKHPRIAVGYGSCSDLYVSHTLLNFSKIDTARDQGFLMGDITNENELLQSFAYFFNNGAAAERYTSNRTMFQQLIESSKLTPRRWSLGGNAPLMGIRFHQDGANVLLGAQMSTKLRKSLPADIKITGDPIEQDDIHLIIEYKTGDEWGPYKAPRANRFILHNDNSNPTINSLEFFEKPLIEFKPRLLVVSGLQMMDNFPFGSGERESRLLKVREQIAEQPNSTLVHFEMASYVEKSLLTSLMKNIIPYTNSIGMNEQELFNLHQFLQTSSVSYASESNPRVGSTVQTMRDVFLLLREANKAGTDPRRRQLTRIHVHTLAFQAIMVRNDSEWRYTKNAAAKAALTAHRHVCGSKIVNPAAGELLMDESFSTISFDTKKLRMNVGASNPVACWLDEIPCEREIIVKLNICVAPVLVCKEARQTAGAGDNISAAGLILQI